MSHGRNATRFASDGASAYTPRRFRAVLGAATGAAVAALIAAGIIQRPKKHLDFRSEWADIVRDARCLKTSIFGPIAQSDRAADS